MCSIHLNSMVKLSDGKINRWRSAIAFDPKNKTSILDNYALCTSVPPSPTYIWNHTHCNHQYQLLSHFLCVYQYNYIFNAAYTPTLPLGPSTVFCVAVVACTVVMRPSKMVNLSFTILASGARQLVVQEALLHKHQQLGQIYNAAIHNLEHTQTVICKYIVSKKKK